MKWKWSWGSRTQKTVWGMTLMTWRWSPKKQTPGIIPPYRKVRSLSKRMHQPHLGAGGDVQLDMVVDFCWDQKDNPMLSNAYEQLVYMDGVAVDSWLATQWPGFELP